ncbi:hypothetical protein HMPREF9336_02418 [Segniliparus rugosus ATCC BAA-974]|uniref:Uncharacterized protein n=1 Tax=Segniliparus rugosus (strain ATCC BAA-974 / DSM 45345 / CCUG 50838 / CIP 108380 / JCM 13579 / CDC 945) TaxID=679197 RepID=E5XSE6_SEGRC|nr:hypothetical protein HMPREF9336_02418 [Segniliparus rugosus ATCC BAA-974]
MCLANACVWAYLIVRGSALPPDEFRWGGLALFAASLIAAVASDGSKRGAEQSSEPYRIAPPLPASPPPTVRAVPPAHDMSKYRAVLADGKKILAIKLLRDDFPHLSLKDAKDIIESL